MRPTAQVQLKYALLEWRRVYDRPSVGLFPGNVNIEDQPHPLVMVCQRSFRRRDSYCSSLWMVVLGSRPAVGPGVSARLTGGHTSWLNAVMQSGSQRHSMGEC